MGTCSRCADPTTGCCESTKAELLPDGMASQPEGGAGRGVLLALKTLKYCRGHASGATIVPPAPLDALSPPRGNRCFSKLSFHPPFPGPLSGLRDCIQKKSGVSDPRATSKAAERRPGWRWAQTRGRLLTRTDARPTALCGCHGGIKGLSLPSSAGR
jgi:hypothetical protein